MLEPPFLRRQYCFVPFLLLIIIWGASALSSANVNRSSKFSQARESASKLDLLLLAFEQRWRDSVFEESNFFTSRAPLVIQTKTYVHCYYDDQKDKIAILGFVTNEDEFFKLSPFNRRELIRQILHLVYESLGPQLSKNQEPTPLKTDDIRLELILNSSPPSARGALKRYGINVGQAGYVDGKIVFTEEYFLTPRSRKDWIDKIKTRPTIIIIPYKRIE